MQVTEQGISFLSVKIYMMLSRLMMIKLWSGQNITFFVSWELSKKNGKKADNHYFTSMTFCFVYPGEMQILFLLWNSKTWNFRGYMLDGDFCCFEFQELLLTLQVECFVVDTTKNYFLKPCIKFFLKLMNVLFQSNSQRYPSKTLKVFDSFFKL